MSKKGIEAATAYGRKLTAFAGQAEAEQYFFAYRDALLRKAEEISRFSSSFRADYTVESLKTLEKWYFELWEKDLFSETGITKGEFESMLGMYFGEVVVRNNEAAKWTVNEFPFAKGKFDLYVNKGLCSMSVSGCENWHSRPGNKRKDLLYRNYRKYFQEN